MIRSLAVCIVLACASCAGTHQAIQLGGGDIGSDWAPVDKPFFAGYAISGPPLVSGLTYEAGAQFGADSSHIGDIEVESKLFEIWGGPRFELHLARVRPYVDGGLSILSTEASAQLGYLTASDSDTTAGAYVGGGVDFDITEGFFMGLGVRQTFGHEPTLAGFEGDSDLTQVFLRIGWSI